MITNRSRRFTGSFGRKQAMAQKMSAAPMQRNAIYVIGVTHSSSRYFVTGTPRPKMMFAVRMAACAL